MIRAARLLPVPPLRALPMLAVLAALTAFGLASCAPSLPPTPMVAEGDEVALDQQWTAEQRAWFHHASQGTVTFGVPLEWFLALQAPAPEGGTLLGSEAYLLRFGFLPSRARGPGNPAGLPIGFAVGAPYRNPITDEVLLNPATGRQMAEFGLTCAACHTGQLVYNGTAITIDGGSAMLDLGKLRTALGLSILETDALPWRFDAFAARVLGPDAPAAAKAALRQQFARAVTGVREQLSLDLGVRGRSVEEGFGRLDALNRIGNEVFAMGMRDAQGRPNRANYAPTDAPVHFPRLWGVPWMGWAQYDGSIQQPMVRNVGEAMGVRAIVNLSTPGPRLFNSSVDFAEVRRIEEALAGPYPPGRSPLTERRFTGLVAPRWPAVLPPIDRARAERGAVLYASLCAGCHMPAPGTAAFWESRWWRPADPGRADSPRYLDPPMIPLSVIGTDPAQATGLATRTVLAPEFLGLRREGAPGTPLAYGRALGDVVERVANRWYDARQLPPGQREIWNGERPNGIQAPLAYRPRSLEGVWATPPYLHNGAVPSLYSLLSPVAERPRTFWLGSRAFDPVRVGYSTAPIPGGFLLDTSRPGNSNRGHEFDDRPRGNGVIGPRLSEDERMALIEYLKSL